MSTNTTTNRVTARFQEKGRDLLNIYFTAGFPTPNATVDIIRHLAEAGVDLIELGLPYSDPLADGPTIQASGQEALAQGMTTRRVLDAVREARQHTEVPIILMGYFNQVLQYGVADFCRDARAAGVDGLILPDLPVEIYDRQYRSIFEGEGLGLTFLITPQTSDDRIRQIDGLSQGFVYMVSSASVTGKQTGFSDAQRAYFARIAALNLDTPRLIGFGISTHTDFKMACEHAH
ncbi:MAG: tryptophan synthase subunit alpha, partial [Bacteroidota bacterium]